MRESHPLAASRSVLQANGANTSIPHFANAGPGLASLGGRGTDLLFSITGCMRANQSSCLPPTSPYYGMTHSQEWVAASWNGYAIVFKSWLPPLRSHGSSYPCRITAPLGEGGHTAKESCASDLLKASLDLSMRVCVNVL
ncbi:hypothetical protein HaLaN_24258 [Haematococcus lacustris]|uniref:Uncharacterized protein n=1 Tax=Haematococcus lacustris TaxID=44745 RepID=A0A699ZTG5_HAELA|nr:hypothetical protein HaLaN_24258 [Haematococcus lacustris]